MVCKMLNISEIHHIQTHRSGTCNPFFKLWFLFEMFSESNEIVDCDEFVAECLRLQCPYGVQRTRVGRCERCACVREETDCAPLRYECERLKCHYGLNRTMGEDGCER